jgi:hypothetical protein
VFPDPLFKEEWYLVSIGAPASFRLMRLRSY